ncbi:hypothetical protein LY90DRAFT_70504 [Neocallimastix californiae]|jgi:hypothetical protein|uniref:Uncharacterized protein n=1 Tax=Neocallimastix californiae TaxID=1754190 RepID=A0A1Y2F5G8_9FUNG|nr:hypothetical protein LY90DRAFT_70504 [Neocallimastix californiae]|eukprot:ORY78724.1 hypothetical protein LY90DRAFT_70504 [Neocallimastix californiae]
MGYFEKQLYRSINSSPKEVVLFDESYVYQKSVTLFIEYVEGLRSPYFFIVKGTNDKEYFKCVYKCSKIFFYTMDGIPVFNYDNSSSPKKIYAGESEDKLIASLTRKYSWKAKKYKVEYVNLLTKKREILDMNLDKGYRTCGVFLGKEKETTPKICRMVAYKKEKNYGPRYRLEISSGVDNMFMIALGISFAILRIKAEIYEKETLINECIKTNNYSVIAEIDGIY